MRDPETGTMVQRKVPTILVCDEPSHASEVARDAIILRLKDRPVAQLKTRSSLELELRNRHPKVIGAIAGLAAKALASMSSVSLDEVHKDASLEKWLLAIDTALNLQGELIAAYRENGARALSDIVDAHPPVQAFRDMLQAKGAVTATPTDMLALVEPFLARPKGPRWPTSGKGFTTILKRHLYALPDVEIEFDVRTGKARDRNIVATWRGVGGSKTKRAKRTPKPSSPGVSETGDQLSLIWAAADGADEADGNFGRS